MFTDRFFPDRRSVSADESLAEREAVFLRDVSLRYRTELFALVDEEDRDDDGTGDDAFQEVNDERLGERIELLEERVQAIDGWVAHLETYNEHDVPFTFPEYRVVHRAFVEGLAGDGMERAKRAFIDLLALYASLDREDEFAFRAGDIADPASEWPSGLSTFGCWTRRQIGMLVYAVMEDPAVNPRRALEALRGSGRGALIEILRNGE